MALEHKLLLRRPGLARLFQQTGVAIIASRAGNNMLRPHGHDVHEAVLVRRGELHHDIAAYKIDTRVGSMDLVPREVTHRYMPVGNVVDIINILIDPHAPLLQELPASAARELFTDQISICQLRFNRLPQLWQIIDEILFEQRYQHYGWEAAIKAQMQLFFNCCDRALHAGRVQWLEQGSANSRHSRMRALLNRIDADPQHNWTLQRIAAELGVSKEQACRRFQQRCGCTPMHYLREQRVLLCQTLIKNGQGIEQAALQSGFRNYQACYRAFVQVCGTHPRDAALTE